MKIPVTPDSGGFVTVNHDLATTDVSVTCLSADGTPVGYYLAVPVDAHSVEVATLPGTDVRAVLVESGEE